MSLSPGMILITDRKAAVRPLLEICEAALGAGFVAVMLREKDLEGRALLDLATPLWEACRRREREFLVNSRLDVALALPGAGAHIGKESLPVGDARGLLGPNRILGYSAHEVDEARRALADGADYVTLSPIFPSISKPDVTPRGLPFLREGAAALSPGKVVALGGVDREQLGTVSGSGVHGAAVMGAMMRAEDPRATAVKLVAAWDRPRA